MGRHQRTIENTPPKLYGIIDKKIKEKEIT